MNIENKEKLCKDCLYFTQHYCKFKGYVKKVNCGHCKNKYKHLEGDFKACKHFQEQNSNATEDAKKSFKKLISSIAKRLNEIAVFINEEE